MIQAGNHKKVGSTRNKNLQLDCLEATELKNKKTHLEANKMDIDNLEINHK